MDERLKSAFDQIHAEEAVKAETRAYLNRARARNRSPRRYLAMAAACLILLLVGVSGYRFYFTPTTILSIDINPSMELGVNRFDQVVSIQAYNQDGKELADSLELKFLDYQTALERLLASQSIVDRLAQGELLSITVVGEDEDQSTRVLAGAEACTAGQENVQCCHGDAAELEEAHHAGLSMGKYQAFLELQALDPTVTTDDVAGLTMRQIQDWIEALENSSTAVEQESQAGGSGGQKNTGNGYGHGHHHGWDGHE